MRSMDMTCDSGGRGGRGGWVSGDAGAETEVTLFSGPTDSLSSFLFPPSPASAFDHSRPGGSATIR